jgi:hypothetical protein
LGAPALFGDLGAAGMLVVQLNEGKSESGNTEQRKYIRLVRRQMKVGRGEERDCEMFAAQPRYK